MTLYIDTKPELDKWKEKPLPHTNRTQFYVDSEFGRYGIYYGNGVYTLLLHTFVSLVIKDDMPDLSEAKATAQADYERRTAERFIKVELPEQWNVFSYELDYDQGWKDYRKGLIANIQSTIAKATEATP